MAEYDRAAVLQEISDVSKDAYGFRVRLDYASMSDAELFSTYEKFLKDVDASIENETLMHQKAWDDFSTYISKMERDYGIDRSTAIHWDMEAENVGDDVGFYCYKKGIEYSHEVDILEMMGGF